MLLLIIFFLLAFDCENPFYANYTADPGLTGTFQSCARSVFGERAGGREEDVGDFGWGGGNGGGAGDEEDEDGGFEECVGGDCLVGRWGTWEKERGWRKDDLGLGFVDVMWRRIYGWT